MQEIYYSKTPGKWIYFGATDNKRVLKRQLQQLFARGYWVKLK